MIKKQLIIKISIFLAFFTLFFSCASNSNIETNKPEFSEETSTTLTEAELTGVELAEAESAKTNLDSTKIIESEVKITKSSSIKLLFGGDIMAHNENYWVDDFSKIWANVLDITQSSDFAFANIESPLDGTKSVSAYPYFNMSKAYVEAAISAGFNVFSLSNNHSSDQGLNGIHETEKTIQELTTENLLHNNKIYFSGLKNGASQSFTYNLIQKEDWTILFLPITELLNLYNNKDYINYSKSSSEGRKKLIEFCKKLREENPCDLFILSFHTAEPEYVRSYEKSQSLFYQELLNAGVDVVWANHAHLIKDRKIIINTQNNTQKLIMYGNGNTISGQRRAPELNQKYPNGERDNTGDGLLYQVIFTKETPESKPKITFAKPFYITTYINTAKHFILRKLDAEFVKYLYNVQRNDWAEYINRRIAINEEKTKDLIEWQ